MVAPTSPDDRARPRERPPRGLSLATWLAGSAAALLAFVGVSVSGSAYLFGRAAIERETLRRLEVVAEARHEALVHVLEGTRARADHLLVILELRCDRVGDPTSREACRRELLENFVRIQGVLAGRLVHADGTVDAGRVELLPELGPVDLPRPPELAAIRKGGQDRYFVVRVSDERLDLAFVLGRGFADPVFASHTGLGHAGETFLTDAEGYFVTPGRYPSTEGHSHPIDSPPMVACLEGHRGAMIAVDYRHVQVIHGYRPVPEVGGGCIMAHIEYVEAFAPVGAFGRTLAGITAGGLLFALLASVVLARRLSAPLERLEARAEALAAGDLESPVPVDGPAELRAYACAFADMAVALRRRVAELDEARRQLDAFNASVTHDLRAPLRAIDGFSAAVLEDPANVLSPASADWLRRVVSATRKMTRIIDDLLVLSRVSRSDLVRVPVDLSDMAHAIAAELRRADPGRWVTLDVAPGLVAEGDPGLLNILMANLLGNAWKFTARTAEPRVEVFETLLGGERVFSVRDNGAGFDPALADRLFEPFVRLHSPREFEGTGIGLATVARIVHRHGGRVWAEAGGPDGGATFSFTLPKSV